MTDSGGRVRRTPAKARPSGTLYGGGLHFPPIPGRIRTATFPLTPLGRRGYRPSEVRRFLTTLAETLTALQDELAMVRTENERLKVHLRQWQSRNSPGRHRAERR
ncbi:DivIVA domain-containing protein [Plantactinospora sp. WMMB782]|uniref:DivIVA domain-containing protein n=1 Tax=Plantactinospora sp. WMMB782 TaxID=3404121 RepID=UPI003B943A74